MSGTSAATGTSSTPANGGTRHQGNVPPPTRGATPVRRLHSSFTVGRIDLDEDQMGSERVLIVDDRNGHVYLWCGHLSTFKHRGFGLEAASALKADNPKGGQVRDESLASWSLVGCLYERMLRSPRTDEEGRSQLPKTSTATSRK